LKINVKNYSQNLLPNASGKNEEGARERGVRTLAKFSEIYTFITLYTFLLYHVLFTFQLPQSMAIATIVTFSVNSFSKAVDLFLIPLLNLPI